VVLKISTMAHSALILSLFFVGVLFSLAACQTDDPWELVPQILSRIKPPRIPSRVCNIEDYDAERSPNNEDVEAPTGRVDANTNAFRNAIQACHNLGGGTVYVPDGTYITSAITLLSNINLQVSPGAIIRFTRDTTKYPIVYTRWEGVELMNYSPFIYAYRTENISITGDGIIDGNCDCDHWWPWKGTWSRQCWNTTAQNQDNARNVLFQMGEDNINVTNRVFGEGDYLRPMFIQPYESKNVLIEGITVTSSPMWIIHPVLCENVIIRNVNINSLGPNSDGIDPESCKDVLIEGVSFNNGDYNIAVNSGRNRDGRRINKPSENIIIRNCTMANGHGAITLGSGCSGGIRNIFAEDCYLDSPNLDTAVRVKNNAIRGGLLDNFHVRNIRVGRVSKQVIEVDYYYEEGPEGDFVPILQNFVVENLIVTGGAPRSLVVKGYPTPNTSVIKISLYNISLSGITESDHFILQDVTEVSAKDVYINGELWNVPGSGGVVATAPTVCALFLCSLQLLKYFI